MFERAIDLGAMPTDAVQGFVAVPSGGGAQYWSLTTLLGRFLEEAERLYGPRDPNWTPIGIEFGGDAPQIWYPGGCRHVAVRLTLLAATELPRAVFQLAHETIHLLAPTGGMDALIIEEGLASVFSDKMAEWCGSNFRTHGSNYCAALSVVQELLRLDPEAVRKIRSHQLRFSDWTPDIILREVPALSEHTAAELCRPFRYNGSPTA